MPTAFSVSGSLLLLAAIGASGLAACGAPEQEESAGASTDAATETPHAVQMNDVSILYPLAKTKGELERAYLTTASKGLGGELLPKDIFEKAMGKPGTTGPGGTPRVTYDNLRVVSIRFDPCFANIGAVTAATNCKNNIRLVFQPTTFSGSSALPTDDAIHAFYSVSRDELKSALDEVVALRLKNDNGKRMGPLAVHPIMKEQGLEGAFAKRLNAIVLKYAGAKNFSRFTQFSTSGLGTAWNFAGFDVAAGATSPMVIPTLPSGTTFVAFFRGFTKDTIAGDFRPPTESPDNIGIFANATLAKTRGTEEQRKAALEAIVKIESPAAHSPETIDCASCHAAQPAREIVADRIFKLSAKDSKNLFVANSKWVPAGDLAQTTKPLNADDVNVHMFSYKAQNPSIHRRTINETADIVAFLNEEKIVNVE